MNFLDFIVLLLSRTEISVLEAMMFICFGVSWPVSIVKAIKTKEVLGKSPMFMSLVAVGYVIGISHKVIYSCDLLIFLYFFNFTMIVTDLYLYRKYSVLKPVQMEPRLTQY